MVFSRDLHYQTFLEFLLSQKGFCSYVYTSVNLFINPPMSRHLVQCCCKKQQIQNESQGAKMRKEKILEKRSNIPEKQNYMLEECRFVLEEGMEYWAKCVLCEEESKNIYFTEVLYLYPAVFFTSNVKWIKFGSYPSPFPYITDPFDKSAFECTL